jgi:cytochrome c oxidase subunit 4
LDLSIPVALFDRPSPLSHIGKKTMSEHHVVPLKIYLLIFFGLMIGTVLTVAAAFVNMGFMNTPVALIIAFIKASLVIMYFMHVKYSPKLVGLFAIAGFFWLSIMLALTMQDYYTRGWGEPLPVEFLKEGASF